MSVRAHQVCRHPALTQLNRTELLVLCRLLAHLHEKTGEARPSLATLAVLTGKSDRTVRRALRRIEAAGVMTTVVGGGRCRASVYGFINPDTQDDRVSKAKPGHFGTNTRTESTLNPDTLSVRPTEERRNGVIHSKTNRKPRPMWDAVVHSFKLSPVTKAERSRVGRIVRDLETKAADPDDIARRLDRYRLTWPNAADTPEALLKHWDRFGEPVGLLDADPVEPSEEDLGCA